MRAAKPCVGSRFASPGGFESGEEWAVSLCFLSLSLSDPPRAKPPLNPPTRKYLHEVIVPLHFKKRGSPSQDPGGGTPK